MDYWGAQAYYTSGGPNGAGLFYNPPPQNESVDFTQPPNTADTTIEEIYTQISNAKPAHLSALADQWQNVYNLLTQIWAQLYNESDTLYNEHWKSSDARDVFMKWGPGQTLAYLDEWMTAALANQSALRALSGIVQDFQGQMDTLWKEYGQAVQDAQHRNAGQHFSDFMVHYNVFGGSDQKDLDAQETQER